METNTTTIIYQETNPYSSVTAFLESDNRTIYLYMHSEFNHDWGIKSVWIRNLVKAPDIRNPEDFKNGLAPLLIKSETYHPEPQQTFQPEEIHFIWTEEGDGVALFVKEELYAFIPAYSGIKGFHGYSKEAKIESITAHPLGDSLNGPIAGKILASRNFWEFRAKKDSWKIIQELRLKFLENKFGNHLQYWSADGGKFPQLAIVKFLPKEYENIILYSTIGMSAQNMPQVELYHKDYEYFSRAEIVLANKISNPEDSNDWIVHLLGDLIKFPWNMVKWFGHGHTIEMSRKDPNSHHLNFTTLLFINPNIFNFISKNPDLTGLISENNKRINFLFAIPITEEEALIVREKGIQSIEKNVNWYHDHERESFF